MKKIVLILILISVCFMLQAQRNWNLYTNTTHMRDLVLYNEQIVIATWGGVEYFDMSTYSFTKTMTMMDGLNDINVVALNNHNNQELSFVIRDKGINRLVNNAFDVSLTQALGLPSLKINSIYSFDNTILVGSDKGLTVFENEAEYPFPLFKNTYNNESGLPFTTVNATIIDSQNYIILGTNIGFSRVHKDSLYANQAWHHYSLGSNTSVNSLAFKDDILAMATTQRVISFNINEINNNLNWNNYLNNSAFSAISIDGTQNDYKIYAVFGTWKDYANNYEADSDNRTLAIINHLHAIEIVNFGNDKLIKKPLTNIMPVNNKLFTTSWGEGLYIFEPKSDNDYTNDLNWHSFKPNSIHTNVITSVVAESSDKVWICDGLQSATGASLSSNGISSLNLSNNKWTHYTFENSNLLSNNIYSIGIDSDNKKWFGSWYTEVEGWANGISVLDDSNPDNLKWSRKTTGLLTLTISDMFSYGNQMWICSFDGGMNIVNNDMSTSHSFIPRYINNRKITTTHKIDGYSFFGSYNAGMVYWESNDIPQTNGTFWVKSDAISSGYVHKIDSWVDKDFTQVWFAVSNGLFMMEKRYNSVNWYKFDIDIKRRRLVNGSFINDMLYYIDEERLFGAEVTNPTALTIDPFGRVWIGSQDKGLAMYDIYEDRFYNYKTSNSQISSNSILSLDYQPGSGLLYIGTRNGLSTVEIGRNEKTVNTLGNVIVYPNPFKPDEHHSVTIKNSIYDTMPKGENECKIFDISGQLITVLNENRFMEFEWDGNNQDGKKCASGVYFYLIKTEIGESAKGKIVLIR